MYDLEISKCYQPLFNLMANEHNLILLDSEMDEIIRTCLLVVENINSKIKSY
jgi:hypothetical protein